MTVKDSHALEFVDACKASLRDSEAAPFFEKQVWRSAIAQLVDRAHLDLSTKTPGGDAAAGVVGVYAAALRPLDKLRPMATATSKKVGNYFLTGLKAVLAGKALPLGMALVVSFVMLVTDLGYALGLAVGALVIGAVLTGRGYYVLRFLQVSVAAVGGLSDDAKRVGQSASSVGLATERSLTTTVAPAHRALYAAIGLPAAQQHVSRTARQGAYAGMAVIVAVVALFVVSLIAGVSKAFDQAQCKGDEIRIATETGYRCLDLTP